MGCQSPNSHPLARPPVHPLIDSYISQVDLVRSFRGAPASIVLILLLSGRPHTLQELEEATSYSDKPVRRAIRFLSCRGVVGKAGGGWSLREHFRRRIVEAFRPPPNAPHAGELASADQVPTTPNYTQTDDRPISEGGPKELSELLTHMGILSPAFETLLGREELRADPALARAWWWYVLTQSWTRNRPGLVIASLNERRDPPPAFLTLARIWPTVAAEDRLEMRDLLWRAWSPEQMALYFADAYPQMTAAVFTAYQSLYEAAPNELNI